MENLSVLLIQCVSVTAQLYTYTFENEKQYRQKKSNNSMCKMAKLKGYKQSDSLLNNYNTNIYHVQYI